MLQRDYIMRLIREFAEALELLLNKNDREQQEQEMRSMYNQYVGPYEFYHTAAISDVMQSFEQFAENERLDRMEMLAELYYAEADMKTGPIRDMLLEKALALFIFVNRHSKTFCMTRARKIDNVKNRLTDVTINGLTD